MSQHQELDLSRPTDSASGGAFVRSGRPKRPARRISVVLHLAFAASVLLAGPSFAADLGSADRETDPAAASPPERTARTDASGVSDADLRWRGPDDTILPFTSGDEVIRFLAEAEIVERKELSTGSTKPWKLTLERDGVRAHAIFRRIDVTLGKGARPFRDHYAHEVAAYELSRLLGLHVVPPATLRYIDGDEGSIQLWVENACSESRRIERGDSLNDLYLVNLQKQRMYTFDALIYNFDRNTGNMLIDEVEKLWLVDHTRAFKATSQLPDDITLAVTERRLWQRLGEIDKKSLRRHMAPYLDARALAGLVSRYEKVVETFATMIAEKGEDRVLIDLPAAY